jgi:hypothetical protein
MPFTRGTWQRVRLSVSAAGSRRRRERLIRDLKRFHTVRFTADALRATIRLRGNREMTRPGSVQLPDYSRSHRVHHRPVADPHGVDHGRVARRRSEPRAAARARQNPDLADSWRRVLPRSGKSPADSPARVGSAVADPAGHGHRLASSCAPGGDARRGWRCARVRTIMQRVRASGHFRAIWVYVLWRAGIRAVRPGSFQNVARMMVYPFRKGALSSPS